MEQAALPQQRLGKARLTFPPGPKAPAITQAVRYLRDPLGFLAGYQRRYGDIFTVRFPTFGRIVYVARPDLVKAVFTGAPSVFHAGGANATVLEPALGPNSVLILDDALHMRRRKLLLPPFHGERVKGYGELIVAMTRREMESWPVDEPFAMRHHTTRITLAVIMRAVFGVHDEDRLARFAVLIEDFARRVGAIAAFPFMRRNLGPLSPWAGVDNYAWIPFDGGVRRCIGAAFAEYEMRTILPEFVQGADLRAVSAKPESVRVHNITLAPARGARVVMRAAQSERRLRL